MAKTDEQCMTKGCTRNAWWRGICFACWKEIKARIKDPKDPLGSWDDAKAQGLCREPRPTDKANRSAALKAKSRKANGPRKGPRRKVKVAGNRRAAGRTGSKATRGPEDEDVVSMAKEVLEGIDRFAKRVVAAARTIAKRDAQDLKQQNRELRRLLIKSRDLLHHYELMPELDSGLLKIGE